ncbi:MAG: methionine--tRNA ligase [Chthoniobacterales bacterium]|nr:methionine--tRNA ligase [Chthoniobacterales bacterium]
MPDKTFFITTAIDYTNAPPHIGHAYEKVLADVIARWHRERGRPVFFLTGVDQHGQKVQQSAEKAGLAPAEFASGITAKFKALWAKLGIAYDGWAETTDPRHIRAVQDVLQQLHDQGDVYKARHSGHYSVRQEQFLTDKERNEQGEFGPEWGEVVFLEEENWYFRLSKYRSWLAEHITSHPDFVFPSFRGTELANAVAKEAGDLCISRPKSRLAWGIELPFDCDYVTYVWFDALMNYATFAGYRAGGDPSLPDFAGLWPCDAHVIGKDILIPAHGIYWPIMLKAAGVEAMPKLLVHGWWNLGGAKVSKSAGNVVDPDALADRFGADGLRYYLMRDIATGQDADFNEERLRARYNADLANDLGNLVNRTVSMVRRYRDGELSPPPGEKSQDVVALEAFGSEAARRFDAAMENYQVHSALDAAWELVAAANGFVESSAPWKLAKDPAQAERLDQVLCALIEASRLAVVLSHPVMPVSADNLLGQLGFPSGLPAVWSRVGSGHRVGHASPVFPRLEDEKAP